MLPPQLVGRQEPWQRLNLQRLDSCPPLAKLSHWEAWKRGPFFPATHTAFKLSPGLVPLEQAMGCFSRISSSRLSGQGNYAGDVENGEMFCSRLGCFVHIASPLPLLGGMWSRINASSCFRLPWVQPAPHECCRSRNWDRSREHHGCPSASRPHPSQTLQPPFSSALDRDRDSWASYCLPSAKGLRGAGFCSSCFGSSLPGGKGNQKPIWAIYRRLSGGAGRQILPPLLTPIYGWGFGDRT